MPEKPEISNKIRYNHPLKNHKAVESGKGPVKKAETGYQRNFLLLYGAKKLKIRKTSERGAKFS